MKRRHSKRARALRWNKPSRRTTRACQPEQLLPRGPALEAHHPVLHVARVGGELAVARGRGGAAAARHHGAGEVLQGAALHAVGAAGDEAGAVAAAGADVAAGGRQVDGAGAKAGAAGVAVRLGDGGDGDRRGCAAGAHAAGVGAEGVLVVAADAGLEALGRVGGVHVRPAKVDGAVLAGRGGGLGDLGGQGLVGGVVALAARCAGRLVVAGAVGAVLWRRARGGGKEEGGHW